MIFEIGVASLGALSVLFLLYCDGYNGGFDCSSHRYSAYGALVLSIDRVVAYCALLRCFALSLCGKYRKPVFVIQGLRDSMWGCSLFFFFASYATLLVKGLKLESCVFLFSFCE